jgi:SAM-dependent methyltransferase
MINKDRCQAILEHYPHLEPYHIDVLGRFEEACDPAGKKVLEIGGGNLPEEVLLVDLMAESWVCVNKDNFSLSPGESTVPLRSAADFLGRTGHVIFDGPAEDVGQEFDGKFDLVFSVAAFEHIGRLPKVLRRMHDSLTPGGKLFANFGPIWSSAVGHHVWVDGESLNFKNDEILPHYAHLIMRPAEMYEWATQRYSVEISEELVYQAYHSDVINRNFAEDYYGYFTSSPFGEFEIEVDWRIEVDPDLQALLESLHPGRKIFDVGGMTLLAKKRK